MLNGHTVAIEQWPQCKCKLFTFTFTFTVFQYSLARRPIGRPGCRPDPAMHNLRARVHSCQHIEPPGRVKAVSVADVIHTTELSRTQASPD